MKKIIIYIIRTLSLLLLFAVILSKKVTEGLKIKEIEVLIKYYNTIKGSFDMDIFIYNIMITLSQNSQFIIASIVIIFVATVIIMNMNKGRIKNERNVKKGQLENNRSDFGSN